MKEQGQNIEKSAQNEISILKDPLILFGKDNYKMLPLSLTTSIESYLYQATNEIPYYSRLKDVAKAIKSENFFQFPLTYPEQLLEDPFGFVLKTSEVVQLSSSGGTYGRRKMLFRTNDDLTMSIDTAVKMFSCAGITAKDRITILQPFDLWNIGHIALSSFKRMGALSIPVGLSSSDEEILDIIRLVKANVIYGTPSKVHILQKYL